MPFAFAPYNFSPVAFLSLGVLFVAWSHCTIKQSVVVGILFTFIFIGVGSTWVFTSFYVHAKISIPLSVFTYGLLLCIQAAPIVGIGLLQARFKQQNPALHYIIFMPSLWVIAEIIRTNLFTGFPFLLVGYSQLDTPLGALAPYVGVYGISFATAMVAGAFALIFQRPRSLRIVAPSVVSLYVLSFAIGYASWTIEKPANIKVALIAGNMAATDRWNKKNRQPILDHFWESSQNYAHVDTIIWPETALPVVIERLPQDYREKLSKYSLSSKTDFLLGAAEMKKKDGKVIYYNSIVKIGEENEIYRKSRLIPFLEYYPFGFGRKFLKKYVDIPMSDYQAGKVPQSSVRISGHPVATSICYEDTFPRLATIQNPEISAMINLSEDGWFEGTNAIPQRIQISRMRAKENERYFVRLANNGISAVINHKGTIIKSNIGNPRESFEAVIQPRTGMTPYMIYGDKLVLGLVATIILGLFGPGTWLSIQNKVKKD